MKIQEWIIGLLDWCFFGAGGLPSIHSSINPPIHQPALSHAFHPYHHAAAR
jgi:hypothetical protein